MESTKTAFAAQERGKTHEKEDHAADKEGEKRVKQRRKPKRGYKKIIKLTNGAVLIVKVNQPMDYDQYVNFYKSIKQSIQEGSMIVPPSVDVIVIDKEGRAVKV